MFAFDSMESLQSTCKWKESIEQVKGDMPYVLLGNKADLDSKDVTPEKIAERQREFNCRYFSVSAFTGEGVQNSVNEIVLKCLEPVGTFCDKFEAEFKESLQGSRMGSETGKFYDL